MDEIFHQVHGLKGVFSVVKVAREMPRRYGKKGELLINYDDTAEARRVSERRSTTLAVLLARRLRMWRPVVSSGKSSHHRLMVTILGFVLQWVTFRTRTYVSVPVTMFLAPIIHILRSVMTVLKT